jgi:succinyl-diaminopimelate desuccinylase
MPTSTTSTTTKTIVELLSHLVRFPTITRDHATNRAALDWVEQQLHGLPLRVKHIDNHGTASLVATTPAVKNPKHPRLWLAAHMDVVPGAASTFNPVVRGGKLYGRGAFDMKFAIAVYIALFKQLGADLAKYDLGLMITTDEEVGGETGVRWLLDQGFRGEAVYNPDSGGSWLIEVGAKGILWWEITATGSSAHASRPWEGVNAIDNLIRFVDNVRSHLASEPCGDPAHWHTTLNFGMIQGGAAANQVPDSATARLDIRLTPDNSIAEIASWIDAAKQAVPGVKAKALLSYAPYRIPDTAPVKLLKDIATEVTGHTPADTFSHGTSDARHFAAHGIPTVTVSPTGGGYHAPGEWVDIEDLGRFYEVTRRFIDAWTKR